MSRNLILHILELVLQPPHKNTSLQAGQCHQRFSFTAESYSDIFLWIMGTFFGPKMMDLTAVTSAIYDMLHKATMADQNTKIYHFLFLAFKI